MFNLKTLLRLNAVSCLAFGAIFALFPAVTAAFVGDPPVWLIATIGVVLILNGLHLLLASRRRTSRRAEVLYFSAGDAGWVLATVALVTTGTFITTGPGIVAALIIAAGVGALGALQFMLVQR